MKGHAHQKTSIRAGYYFLAMPGLLLLALSLPAAASLGASQDSVQDDQLRLEAKVTTTAKQAYILQELKSPLGIVVREYVSSAGKVFAISWQGPFEPDMKQILGGYFVQYSQAAKVQRESQIRHSSLRIQQPSFVFQSAGHLRAYFGRAYDPQLLPAGVNPDEL